MFDDVQHVSMKKYKKKYMKMYPRKYTKKYTKRYIKEYTKDYNYERVQCSLVFPMDFVSAKYFYSHPQYDALVKIFCELNRRIGYTASVNIP